MSPRIMNAAVVGCLIMAVLSGCAGPMSPFGAINRWSSRAEDTDAQAKAWNGVDTRVRFLPEHQVLHGAVPFSIVIEDPAGVPDDFELKLTYNGIDVTSKFLAQAEYIYMDPEHQRLRLSIEHLRILAARENRILAAYRRTPEAKAVVARYELPQCSAFEASRSLASIPDFEPPPALVQMINSQALSHQLNPYFVAGLIAQESGFDPQALSRSRALGLTQITSQGEAEVLKSFTSWPRFTGIEDMPFPMLRMAILNGKINSGNEWRLNPVLSIQGGIEYLSYLSEYWSRSDKRGLIENNLGDSDTVFSEVMLASYNSGASRVSAALEEHGGKYLQDENLGEARKYVRRVVSYCDYFAHRED